MSQGSPLPPSNATSQANKGQIRFGTFEADLRAGELRKNGFKIKLHGQPFAVLAMLLDRPGEVVTREELQQKLWASDTFVDFEHGLNKAINKLREALGDDAENPRYIETLPRMGYRLIVPIVKVRPEEAVPPSEKRESSTKRSGGKWWVAGVLGGIVVIVIGGGLWLRRQPAQPRVMGYRQLTTDRQMKGRGCKNFRSRIVSDGTRVYFSERPSGLLQVSASGGDVAKVPNPFACFLVYALSPDKTELLGSAWAIESASNSPLWALSPTSGQARRIGNLNGHAGTWSPDGQRIAYASGMKWEGPDDLYIGENDGSNPQKMLRFERARIEEIAWSPDSRILRMSVSGQVWEVAADGSNLHAMNLRIAEGDSIRSISWTPDGRYFVLTREGWGFAGSIWGVREEHRHFEVRGNQPVLMTSAAMDFLSPTISPDGKKIFTVGGRARGELVRYDVKLGKLEPFLGGISAEHVDFSQDGEWVTYVSFPEGILWKSRVDGSERIQLTTTPLRATLPKWSPDGTRIAFSGMMPGGHLEIYVVSSGGGGAERVYKSAAEQVDEAWMGNGNFLLFGGSIWANEKKIFVLDMRTKEISSLPGSEGMFSPRLSPDERYVVAYDMEHDARLALFDTKTAKWSVLTDRGLSEIQWSRDSRYLYFQGFEESKPISFARLRIADRRVESLGKLDLPEGTVGVFGPWMGLTPDGSPLILRDLSVQEMYALDVEFP